MRAVVDASSLIMLARLGGLSLLERVIGIVALTPQVEVEAVQQGKASGYGDALAIEALILSKTLVVVTLTAREVHLAQALEKSRRGLSLADCTAIVCARERQMALLIEDRRARRVAQAESVTCIELLSLPLRGYLEESLTFDECTVWTLRIGGAVHADPAVLRVLQASAAELNRLRREQKENET